MKKELNPAIVATTVLVLLVVISLFFYRSLQPETAKIPPGINRGTFKPAPMPPPPADIQYTHGPVSR